jgi:hypothetical protein
MSIDFPSWITAVSTAGALLAAGLAARWTAKTAKSAEQQVAAARGQVEAANGQLELVGDQLELAKSEAEGGRRATQAAEQRFLRAQLDSRAPVVYARAMPGGRFCIDPNSNEYTSCPAMTMVTREQQMANRDSIFFEDNALTSPYTAVDGDSAVFTTIVTIEFVNCSALTARVAIPDRDRCTLFTSPGVQLRQGDELFLPPNEARTVVWLRRFSSTMLTSSADPNATGLTEFRLNYWARDLGINTRDAFLFNLTTCDVAVDGSRLIINPQPPYPWTEKFAGQFKDRIYERLEAAFSYPAGEENAGHHLPRTQSHSLGADMGTSTKTPEQKTAEREALLDQLHQKIASLTNSAEWTAYLRFLGSFRNYSPRNILLIMTQFPDASHVVGYRARQQLGRHVRKGERHQNHRLLHQDHNHPGRRHRRRAIDHHPLISDPVGLRHLSNRRRPDPRQRLHPS